MPCKATGCWGISTLTGPIERRPLFLSRPRLVKLEYRVWLLPMVTLTTVLKQENQLDVKLLSGFLTFLTVD